MLAAAYSIWTNYNFKYPILAGALTCLISNVMYLLSYDARSLSLLIASRFIMGFGKLPQNQSCMRKMLLLLCVQIPLPGRAYFRNGHHLYWAQR